jgi:hypothetical protein
MRTVILKLTSISKTWYFYLRPLLYSLQFQQAIFAETENVPQHDNQQVVLVLAPDKQMFNLHDTQETANISKFSLVPVHYNTAYGHEGWKAHSFWPKVKLMQPWV